jgi:DNA-binding NarL/FixJ family response regulator
VQSAFDTKYHLIITHEVTNVGIDKDYLSPMAGQARDALEAHERNKGSVLKVPAKRLPTNVATSSLSCMAQGTPNKVIAYKLQITEATEKVHVKAILRNCEDGLVFPAMALSRSSLESDFST